MEWQRAPVSTEHIGHSSTTNLLVNVLQFTENVTVTPDFKAEAMGQSVLANQFVSGLQLELKSKVVGFEGNFEQLLVKARFEEAKLRDLAQPRNGQ